jgi:hypothetical protein
VREDGVALEARQLERRRQPVEHLLDQLVEDAARVLELEPREESAVAGDVGEDEVALADGRHAYSYFPSDAATVLPSVTVETFCSA